MAVTAHGHRSSGGHIPASKYDEPTLVLGGITNTFKFMPSIQAYDRFAIDT